MADQGARPFRRKGMSGTRSAGAIGAGPESLCALTCAARVESFLAARTTDEEVAMIDWGDLIGVCILLGAACSLDGCGSNAVGACDSLGNAPLVQCPGLFTLLVAPDQVEVGGSVAVTATTEANLDGGATQLSWSAQSGTFSDPNAALTTFTCTAPGTVALHLTVTRESCTETLSASVTCAAASDDGGIDAGD
jgi:hypothetical protein